MGGRILATANSRDLRIRQVEKPGEFCKNHGLRRGGGVDARGSGGGKEGGGNQSRVGASNY